MTIIMKENKLCFMKIMGIFLTKILLFWKWHECAGCYNILVKKCWYMLFWLEICTRSEEIAIKTSVSYSNCCFEWQFSIWCIRAVTGVFVFLPWIFYKSVSNGQRIVVSIPSVLWVVICLYSIRLICLIWHMGHMILCVWKGRVDK